MKFSTIFVFSLVTYATLASAQNFREQNADDAEKLQKQFDKLSPNSPCKVGDACVKGQFAQCVGGKFVLNSCGGGELKCVVLPLVNKKGTSITCSTEADRKARLADARKGSKSKKSKSNDKKQKRQAKGDIAVIRKKNADQAEALQNKFKSFKEDQKCAENEEACVGEKFAKCANGKFALSACASGTKCAVLPLVLKEGVSITCTTEADRVARLEQARKNE
ncbi:1431_t:CDS:1 [Funneliformis mosseae]|uniref:1431_t:CDS:1 n=1 Tax=Funneliformis mosseae TaxID=27381 RepID=A0A9N9CCL5_FUNMO|nr:1431_t:CDS:1 [Funneliformis mosseae]